MLPFMEKSNKSLVFLLLLEKEDLIIFVIKEHDLLCNDSHGFGD